LAPGRVFRDGMPVRYTPQEKSVKSDYLRIPIILTTVAKVSVLLTVTGTDNSNKYPEQLWSQWCVSVFRRILSRRWTRCGLCEPRKNIVQARHASLLSVFVHAVDVLSAMPISITVLLCDNFWVYSEL